MKVWAKKRLDDDGGGNQRRKPTHKAAMICREFARARAAAVGRFLGSRVVSAIIFPATDTPLHLKHENFNDFGLRNNPYGSYLNFPQPKYAVSSGPVDPSKGPAMLTHTAIRTGFNRAANNPSPRGQISGGSFLELDQLDGRHNAVRPRC